MNYWRFVNAKPLFIAVLFSMLSSLVQAQTVRQHLPKNNTQYRPAAHADTFPAGQCGPYGKKKTANSFFDADLNYGKNRIDWPKDSMFLWVTPNAITEHKSPNFQGKARKDWTGAKADSISVYEGLALVIDGYIVDDKRYTGAKGQGAEMQGPESTNCGAVKGDGDIHIWIAPSAHQRFSKAIVAEMTPRVIAENGWGSEADLQSKLKALAKQGIEVEVYGWLLFDQEHYTQLKTTGCGAAFCPRRATLWELHPIMDFKVKSGNRFIPLADWQP